jgi:hypothetical protein
VFIAKALRALQFDNEHVFNQDVRTVFSNILALIADDKLSLTASPDATKPEFPEQSPLINLLKESGPQCIRDLKNSPDHAISKRIRASKFLSVHEQPT